MNLVFGVIWGCAILCALPFLGILLISVGEESFGGAGFVVAIAGLAFCAFGFLVMTNCLILLQSAPGFWHSGLRRVYQLLARAPHSVEGYAQALRALASEMRPSYLRFALRRVIAKLDGGTSFAAAAAAAPLLFPSTDLAVLEAAEKAKSLPNAFTYLQSTKRSSGWGAVPFLVLSADIAVVVLFALFLLVIIIPKFKEIFDQLGGELPFLTQFLIDASYIVSHYGLVLGLGCALVCWLLISRPALALRMFPALRGIYWRLPLSRFSYVLASLHGTALSVAERVSLAVRASGCAPMKRRERKIQRLLAKGRSLGEALAVIPALPNEYRTLQAQSALEDAHGQPGVPPRNYDAEYADVLSYQWTVLLPSIVLMLVIMVGIVVVALYLPLFNIPKLVGKD